MEKNKLKKIIVEIFRKYKLSKSHSIICADAIINAELVGAYGHGLSRMKMYCDRIKKKVINLSIVMNYPIWKFSANFIPFS